MFFILNNILRIIKIALIILNVISNHCVHKFTYAKLKLQHTEITSVFADIADTFPHCILL